ncbi:hypothetical protein L596_006526 [Steinernema carpocapsae]|uniref:Uncharacterized protein n=1 Tax=Steinernema carpocapsae TaxID=34508 RepID=A0A4U8V4V3_STECR|nr:hypothetical protein L596_006526 [Steinernema carpocapsae]
MMFHNPAQCEKVQTLRFETSRSDRRQRGGVCLNQFDFVNLSKRFDGRRKINTVTQRRPWEGLLIGPIASPKSSISVTNFRSSGGQDIIPPGETGLDPSISEGGGLLRLRSYRIPDVLDAVSVSAILVTCAEFPNLNATDIRAGCVLQLPL